MGGYISTKMLIKIKKRILIKSRESTCYMYHSKINFPKCIWNKKKRGHKNHIKTIHDSSYFKREQEYIKKKLSFPDFHYLKPCNWQTSFLNLKKNQFSI